MACYAFRDGIVEETYSQHVDGIIECMAKSWEFRALTAKLSRLLHIEREEIRRLIALSAILHDIGKLERGKQDECTRTGCTRFEYHYAISARVASSLAHDVSLTIRNDDMQALLSGRGLDDRESLAFYVLVLLPILLHHYAQITEESLDEAVRKTRHLEIFEVHECCRRVLGDLLERHVLSDARESGLAFKLARRLKDLLDRAEVVRLSALPFSSRSGGRSVDELFAYQFSEWKYAIEAVTGILNMCDGRVAFRHRARQNPVP
ncbi:MAG: HD domain-containing protein [Acidilobaceae archaeon]